MFPVSVYIIFRRVLVVGGLWGGKRATVDKPHDFVDDFVRNRLIVENYPFQADKVGDANQAIGEDFGVKIPKFSGFLGFTNFDHISCGKVFIVLLEHFFVDE